ncbi:MAG: glycine cleavage T C-terminal barrel domain-containing protein, partial [Brevundimonas sp.]|nr:glycine cleavage T C-terminal barrel domain-containing protein [Brevundimonas sp.]
FPGADRILKELADGPSRVRVGLHVKEGAPAREGAEIADADGQVIGTVTSGGPSPTLGHNIAMGYVPPHFAALGTDLKVIVRGKPAAATVIAMPFVAQRYYRKPKA